MKKKSSKKNIVKKFNSVLHVGLFTNVLILILGVLCLFKPAFLSEVIGIITGIIIIIYASSMIYSYLSRNGAKLYSLNLIFGILLAILGIVLVVYPYTFITFVSNCIAVFLIIVSAIKLNYAFWLMKAKEETWIIRLVTGLLLLVFGIIMLTTSFGALEILQVIGVFLSIVSVFNIMDVLLFKKRSNEIIKIFW